MINNICITCYQPILTFNLFQDCHLILLGSYTTLHPSCVRARETATLLRPQNPGSVWSSPFQSCTADSLDMVLGLAHG